MARAGFNIPLRYIGVAVAFVLTTVVAYQVGRRRAPEPAELASHDDGTDTTEGEGDPAPPAGEPEAAPAPADGAGEPDAASPIIIMPPPPPPRPPREVLIVGKRPTPVPDEIVAAEPGAPPVAPAPAAPAAAPAAVLNGDVAHSAFDDEDKIDNHPVPDRGSVTRSSFDDEDRIDRHPVP